MTADRGATEVYSRSVLPAVVLIAALGGVLPRVDLRPSQEFTGGTDLILPAVGRIAEGNTTFVTDITISNPSSNPIPFQMVFVRDGQNQGQPFTDTLAPRATREFPDVATTIFKQVGILGAVRITAQDSV